MRNFCRTAVRQQFQRRQAAGAGQGVRRTCCLRYSASASLPMGQSSGVYLRLPPRERPAAAASASLAWRSRSGRDSSRTPTGPRSGRSAASVRRRLLLLRRRHGSHDRCAMSMKQMPASCAIARPDPATAAAVAAAAPSSGE